MAKLDLISKLIRLPLKMVPSTLVVPILYGDLKGSKWITGSSNHGYWLGLYEKKVRNKIKEYLKSEDIFLDLGAHVGYFTLFGSKLVGVRGKVYAFEPLPENLAFLKRHIELNKVQNVELFEGAIAHFDGRFKMNNTSRVGAKLSDSGSIDVTVFSLKRLWDEKLMLLPNVMKIDIEGAELELLKDIQYYLDEFVIQILLSTHGSEVHKGCLDLLTSIGYEFIPLDGSSLEDCTEFLATKE